MTDDVRVIPLGEATVSVINLGNLVINLAEIMNVAESEWRPDYAEIFEHPHFFPSQCVHITLLGASVLVDANDYDVSARPGSPYRPPHYQPPPGLIPQLQSKGIHPEDITHLIITHAHFDHYAGVTVERDGQYVPSFPNARCFLGQADWEDAETQQALHDPNSNDSRTLGVLHRQGMLELVMGNRDLLPEIRIITAPGESAGHQIVRVHSQGQTLYCLGDLYHHPVEAEQPAWMCSWAHAETNLSSRRALEEAALSENALLIASHILTPGRLERTASGVKWTAV